MAINTITYNWGSTYQFDTPSFSIDRDKKTIFLIHGFQSNPNQAFGDSSNPESLSKSLEKIYSYPDPNNPQNTITPNIINVDWSSLASLPGEGDKSYFFVKERIDDVAWALSNAFKTLNIDPTKTEIIGHSLGAHIAGIAGQEFKKDGSPPINQIIGLDPAGPFLETASPDQRISPDDAQRVVVIHSSNSLTAGFAAGGLGLYRDDLGALDVYIKQYGQVYGKSVLDSQNHGAAIDVYKQLVNGLLASGSNQFGTDLHFNDFVNLQKLNDPNLTGEYTINLDTFFNSDGTNQTFSSNGPNNNDTYRFDADDFQGWDIIGESTIALKTAHNSYIRADAGPALFQSPDLGIGQEFQIIPQDDGKIGLKTYRNKYVKASTFWVVEQSDALGEWEKFVAIDRGSGNIGLLTHWGDSYLQAFPFGNGLGTISQSWNLGDWETFTPVAQNLDVDILDFSPTLTHSISVNLNLPGAQKINDNLTLTLGTTLAGVSYVDIENVSGGSLGDTLEGNTLNNFLQGNGGDDLLSGSAGNDILDGADGNDTASYRYAALFGTTQGIDVSLAAGMATNDGFGNQDILSGIENIFGSQNNDNIVGNDFNNSLDGALGNDILTGMGGADAFGLSFPVSVAGSAVTETITDFSPAQGDKLYIAAGSFPASVDQFAYNPGDGVLSFRGVPYAFITNIPQDFNVHDIVISPPLPDYSITIGY
jgi:Ca2+-binding RTX toxin-like protein